MRTNQRLAVRIVLNKAAPVDVDRKILTHKGGYFVSHIHFNRSYCCFQ